MINTVVVVDAVGDFGVVDSLVAGVDVIDVAGVDDSSSEEKTENVEMNVFLICKSLDDLADRVLE